MSKQIIIPSSSDDEVSETQRPNAKEYRRQNYLILCKMCLERRVGLIFIPCRHACLCESCYDKMSVPKACPMCDRCVFRTYEVRIED